MAACARTLLRHGLCACRASFRVTAQRTRTCDDELPSASPAVAGDIRQAIEAKYPNMILQFFDFQQGIRDNLVGDRMMAMLSGFFGVLKPALLVVVGLYGVLSFFISQRRNEIGIRIALGAGRRQVTQIVMRDTAVMLLAGVLAGTVLALLAGRTAGSMLYGLKAYDLTTMAGAFILLTVISFMATWLPARKASRLDPVSALRRQITARSTLKITAKRPPSRTMESVRDHLPRFSETRDVATKGCREQPPSLFCEDKRTDLHWAGVSGAPVLR